MAKSKRAPCPGAVVRAVTAGVDFGKLTYKPGDYGVICDVEFSTGWFGVHWHTAGRAVQSDYMCHLGPQDVEVLPESKVGRITGSWTEASSGIKVVQCAYCVEQREGPRAT